MQRSAASLASLAVAWLYAAIACAAHPVMNPDAATLRLDDLGLYEMGYFYRGQPEQYLPVGWPGPIDERTGITYSAAGTQAGRLGYLIHCPWRGGTGIAFQQYTFALPRATRILVRGAFALRSEVIGKSDGATFRVLVQGRTLLGTHWTSDAWREFEFNLTEFAGTTATIRFETDPGPADNSSWDHSLWADRTLVLEGFTPTPISHPTPPALTLASVWSAASGDVAPPSGFAGTTSSQLADSVASFKYEGPDGTLEYRWERPLAAADGLFGTLTLRAHMTGDAEVIVPFATSAGVTWTQTATPTTSYWEPRGETIALVRMFQVGPETVAVRITGALRGKSLTLTVSCSRPLVSAFDAGVWGPVMRRERICVPYYSGNVYLLPHENLFVNAFLDWTASSASSHDQPHASYGALTNGARNLLQERVVFAAAWHLAEVFPNIPNSPSPHRASLADKIVLDIWGGNYTTIAERLEELTGYGIANCAAIIHMWQRSGYDNALPMHLPANAALGGDAGMQTLVATGNRLGIPIALHENYVDYYPNYDFFDANDIALDSAGDFILAWFNPGTEIQSFAVKPNAILRLAGTQSPEIHRRFDTCADYLDVHSAVPPWFHVDFRAGETGAGTFRRVWDVHRELWAYERATHSGPVLGEGANHWFWSGCLDGVEAQFGWDPSGRAAVYQGMTAPLAVDFDLLKIHPLQVNHGMGYYGRWWPEDYEASFAGTPPLVVLDQYRMQEAAFGHAGFLDSSVYSTIPLAWLEHHLLSPVMARYAMSRPTDIRYEAGGAWLDATAAAKTGDGGTGTRVRVTYENGLVVTANGGDTALREGTWTLPRFGWIATGAGITAGTVYLDGIVVDFADQGSSLFVNARSATDWYLTRFRRIRPSVASFQQTAARTFRASYRWEVEDRLQKDYRSFVHFTTAGEIRWQQDHSLTPATSSWQPGQTITDGPYTISVSASIPDGDYDWRIGLFDTASGERVRLLGVDDGTSRIRLGTLRVAGGGATVAFIPETGAGVDPTPTYREHLNESGQVIDFGAMRTDGSALVRLEDDEWALLVWPRTRNFTLELNTQRFARPAKVQCIGGPVAEVAPVDAGQWWRLPLNGSREYHWSAGARFRRGDVNGDRTVDLADAISGLSWLFAQGKDPVCEDAADVNDDGTIDVADSIFILQWLFAKGPTPRSPGPQDCGIDPNSDPLRRCDYPAAACAGGR